MGNGLRASLLLVVVAFCSVLTAQDKSSKSVGGSPAGSEPAAVLKTTTRMVVLDVIAADKQGNPVTDLKADDFTVLEKEQKQQIKSFEFQRPAQIPTDGSATPFALKLPPNIFSNKQFPYEPKTLNFLLLDALNTTTPNQMYVRQQMLRFVEMVPSGQLVAVYALNHELRLLQDFTTDTGVLKEIAKNFRPERSAVVTDSTGGPKDQLLTPGALTRNPSATVLLEMLQMSRAEQSHYDFCIRFETTVQALRTFAGTLAGYSGRKNIIWVSEIFPLRFFDDNGQEDSQCSFDVKGMLKNASNTLADAHIAVYPVDAAGLIVSGMDAASSGYDEFGRSQAGGEAYGSLLRQQFNTSVDNHANMDGIAKQTGGRAFYNRNDLGNAIQSGMTDGSTYYLLGYYPSDKNWNGEFRNVQVTVSRPGVDLRYRPGYYSIEWTSYAKDTKVRESQVAEALNVAKPLSTALFLTAAVTLPSAQTGGKMVVKYDVDARSILFEPGDDGLQHADVTCWVRAFDQKGHPLKATSQTTAASLKLDTYQRIMKTGFPCSAELELPAGKYLLRFAVRDERTGKMGTANGKVTIAEGRRVEKTSYPLPEIELASKEVVLPVFSQERLPPRLEAGVAAAESIGFCKRLLAGQEHAGPLQSVCEHAISAARLADYLCEQNTVLSTHRIYDPADKLLWDLPGNQVHEYRKIGAQVRFVGGTESYSDIKVDGHRTNESMFVVSGASGQYSSVLQALFDPRNDPEFRFSKEVRFNSVPAFRYEFDVRLENNKSLWFLQSGGTAIHPGYSGQLWIQKDTGQLMRLEMQSTDVPRGVRLESRVRVDYAEVSIGDRSKYVLPVKADSLICGSTPKCDHNSTTFSNFRKFKAEHRILPTGSSQPETQAGPSN